MLKKRGIDSLFLFLTLSMLFLWVAFPQIKTGLFGDPHYIITNLSVDDQVSFPKQGIYEDDLIRLNNDNLTLLYSRNGGQDFIPAENGQLKLDDIQNESIIYRSTSIRWRHPKGDFPGLKNIVLKVRDEANKTESQPKVVTYFNKDLLCENDVVNITIDQSDLFDWKTGIMILGESSSNDSGFYKDWWFRAANFANRGYQSGRKVTLQFFKNDGDYRLDFETNAEMRISGNASRYFAQKSFKFFPLGENGRRTEVPSLLNDDHKTSSLLFRQSGNDNSKTMYADLLMHQLARESNVLVLQGYPISVFINGNYWGIYNFRDRIDTRFIAENEKVKESKVTILSCEGFGEIAELKEGSNKVKMQFDSLIQQLPVRIENEEMYDQVKKEISIKSFIDYIIFETYYGNQDWLHNNTTWYKADDKKWKWVLNDLDYSLAYPGIDNVNSNLFDKLLSRNSITGQLFSSLISYPKFKTKFQDRVAVILSTLLAEKVIKQNFKLYNAKFKNEIDRQIRRWRFIDSVEQWEKDCAKNETFLLERRIIYQKQVQAL